MRAAHIENGIVANVIETTETGPNLVATETGNIGDRYEGGVFIPPQITEPESVRVVPQEISKAQGIVVMSEVPVGDSNLWLTVKAYFDTEADEISRDLFKAVTVFNRQSPMLNALKDRFGLDDAALDLLFIEGAQVVV